MQSFVDIRIDRHHLFYSIYKELLVVSSKRQGHIKNFAFLQ